MEWSDVPPNEVRWGCARNVVTYSYGLRTTLTAPFLYTTLLCQKSPKHVLHVHKRVFLRYGCYMALESVVKWSNHHFGIW